MLRIIEDLIHPAPPPFRPLPPPLPPRKPCGESCNPQLQSPFLNVLPGEIRNEIYRYAFSVTAEEKVLMDEHPLSLLRTCHKINHEATNLAFHTYAFSVRPSLRSSFLTFRTAISHLSAQQVSAITALTYDLGKEYMLRGIDVATAVTNALLLLPNMKRFEIHVCNTFPKQDLHDSPLLVGFRYNDVQKDAIEKYAPAWFDWRTLRPVAEGTKYMWQKGEKWRIEWPQLESPYFQEYVDNSDVTAPYHIGYMDPSAVGHERGVHMCPCHCGNVCWVSANLVQETGRVVHVDTCFYGPPVFPPRYEDRFADLKLRLHPGAERLPVKEGHKLQVDEWSSTAEPVKFKYELTSLAYDANEEYWEEMRQRNWNLRSVLRGYWSGGGKKEEDKESSEVGNHDSAEHSQGSQIWSVMRRNVEADAGARA